MRDIAIFLNVIGAVIGSVAACWYAVCIWRRKLPANLATWFIVLLLDFAGLYLAYVTGNKEPYIQFGWCIAAIFILIAVWKTKGDWQWSRIETFVLVACVASIVVWLTSEAVVISLLGYLVAAFISVWPQAKDYLRNPDGARKSAWVWQISVVALLFPLAAKFVSKQYGVEHTLVYYAILGLNLAMVVICMRKVA